MDICQGEIWIFPQEVPIFTKYIVTQRVVKVNRENVFFDMLLLFFSSAWIPLPARDDKAKNCSLRTKESLPHWGRWHGAAVTEEVLPQYVFAARQRKHETLYRTSPAPYGGTLPKGEGLRLRRQTIIYKHNVPFSRNGIVADGYQQHALGATEEVR